MSLVTWNVKSNYLSKELSNFVKLNLFSYVLALFCAKFACNSTFRNPIFGWE